MTVVLATNPGGGTLGGALTVTADGGVATFGGLTVDHGASGYTLQASSSGLTGTVTSSFARDPPAGDGR